MKDLNQQHSTWVFYMWSILFLILPLETTFENKKTKPGISLTGKCCSIKPMHKMMEFDILPPSPPTIMPSSTPNSPVYYGWGFGGLFSFGSVATAAAAALGKVEHEEPNAEFAACTWKQFSLKDLDSCSVQEWHTCMGPLTGEQTNLSSKKLGAALCLPNFFWLCLLSRQHGGGSISLHTCLFSCPPITGCFPSRLSNATLPL